MVTFLSKPYHDLTTAELYNILALRAEVFVVEQNCPYQDVDGKDVDSIHLLGFIDNELMAYARILKPGISYKDYASIGRIVISPKKRGNNYGHELISYSINQCKESFVGQPIKISAQSHLEKFYSAHGFLSTGEAYLEDGIPHIAMIYNKK